MVWVEPVVERGIMVLFEKQVHLQKEVGSGRVRIWVCEAWVRPPGFAYLLLGRG